MDLKLEYAEYIGQQVYIETLRYGYIGTVAEVTPRTMLLTGAARLMETPPWRDFQTGSTDPEYTLPFAGGEVRIALPVREISRWEGEITSFKGRS